MSTRLRVVLKYPSGEQIRGPMAVATLCYMLKPTSNRKFVLGALHGSKRERLEALATKLPKGYALMLVQEPRRTRRNRSFCWGKVAMPPAQPAPQIRIQAAPEFAEPLLPPPPALDAGLIQAARQMQQVAQQYRWNAAPVPPFRPRRRRNVE